MPNGTIRKFWMLAGQGALTVLLCLPAAAGPFPAPAEEWSSVDRVVAVVGGTPLTLRQARVSASLTRGRVIEAGEKDLLQEAIERLVDQEIILRELAASGEDLAVSVSQNSLREALVRQAGGEASLRYIRSRLGITDEEWNQFVLRASALDEFVRNRFRPFVYVSQDDVRAYFEKVVLNGKRAEGEDIEQYRERIRQILEELRVNEEFTRWLENRRKELGISLLF